MHPSILNTHLDFCNSWCKISDADFFCAKENREIASVSESVSHDLFLGDQITYFIKTKTK